MPAPIFECGVKVYKHASDFPAELWAALKSNPRDSNIIYPHALKTLAKELEGLFQEGQVWITCTSNNPPSIDFILSCTEGPIGSYPVFIFSPDAIEDSTDEGYLSSRILQLVDALHNVVYVDRVFSVFAPDRVAELFAHFWTGITGVRSYSDPYYSAKLSYCTRQSLSKRQMTIHPDVVYELRPAVESDIFEAAELCYGFASKSDPFFLTKERAIEEATLLTQNGQLWVHRIASPGDRSEIASIVAVTRSCDQVAAITKVYTNPKWRSRGCAERLVRRVCKHLLASKQNVILYVAHDNPAAQKVYHRVGFAGLGASSDHKMPKDVSSWTEIGFDQSQVHLGHW